MPPDADMHDSHVFTSKELLFNGKNIVLNIWDTAGQEAYRYLVPMYYRNADIAIVVFDLTKKITFVALHEWVQDVRKNVGEDVLVYICGNKSDLTDKRAIREDEIKGFQKEYNVAYFETSALNGENIEKLFNGALENYLKLFPDGNNMKRQNVQEIKSGSCC